MQSRGNYSLPLICVALLALLPAFILGLQTDFPLLDDEYYFWSIDHLRRLGEFKFMATTPTCFIPLSLGALANLVWGPSYVPLHLLSLAFSLGTGLTIFSIIRHLGLRHHTAVCAAAIFWTNPMVVFLSICYMTDLPWLFFSALCLLFLLKALNRSSASLMTLSLISLISAILCRQTAIFLVSSFIPPILFFVLKRKQAMLLPFLLLIPALFICNWSDQFATSQNLYPLPTIAYKDRLHESFIELFSGGFAAFRYIVLTAAKTFSYLGFYLLALIPPAVIALLGKRRFLPLSMVAAAGAFFLCCSPLSLALIQGDRAPYSVSIFFPPYVGSYCIFQDSHKGWTGSEQFQLTLCLIAIGTAFAFVFWQTIQLVLIQLLKELRRLTVKPKTLFICSVLSLFSVSLAFFIVQSRVINFDRYNIGLLIPALIIITFAQRFSGHGKRRHYLSFGLLAIMYAYSSLALWDCFSFNQCKWSLIRGLVKSGVSALEIDGGPEFNLSSNTSLFAKELLGKQYGIGIFPAELRGGVSQKDYRWWPISGDRFLVSNAEFPGYSVLTRKRYWSPLSLANKEILVLERSNESP